MEHSDKLVTLPELTEGMCVDCVQVKVDRIIRKEVVRYPMAQLGPMTQLEQFKIVVFDRSYKRRFLVIDDERVMLRFGSAFAKERTLRISHFLVCKAGEGDRVKFYLKLQLNSLVQRDVVYLPRHCFSVVTLPQIVAGYTEGFGVFDVCGFLVALYEPGMSFSLAAMAREAVIVLEDRTSTGQSMRLTCTIHGPCVDPTLQGYRDVPCGVSVFVVIQNVICPTKDEGVISLSSYYDGTRVHYNPVFPEVIHQRAANMGRLVRPNATESLPLV